MMQTTHSCVKKVNIALLCLTIFSFSSYADDEALNAINNEIKDEIQRIDIAHKKCHDEQFTKLRCDYEISLRYGGIIYNISSGLRYDLADSDFSIERFHQIYNDYLQEKESRMEPKTGILLLAFWEKVEHLPSVRDKITADEVFQIASLYEQKIQYPSAALTYMTSVSKTEDKALRSERVAHYYRVSKLARKLNSVK